MTEVQAAGDLVVPWAIVLASIGLIATLARAYVQDRNGHGIRPLLRQIHDKMELHTPIHEETRDAIVEVSKALGRHDRASSKFHSDTTKTIGDMRLEQAQKLTAINVKLGLGGDE